MQPTGSLTIAASMAVLGCLLAACDMGVQGRIGWVGTVDTLPSGQLVVRNPIAPMWHGSEGWRTTEEWRIGGVEGDGPDVFGQIASFDVDDASRVWILDGLTHELRVFDASGQHLMTLGREGQGPGEFARPEHVERGPDGNMWVVDVGNNRISRFDATGSYLGGQPIPSGYPITPWVGGFDSLGRFYTPVESPPDPSEQVAFTYVRHNPDLVPVDTIRRPHDPEPRHTFEFNGMTGRVPLQGTLVWHLTAEGHVLALVTDEYRLIEFAGNGDTVRTIFRSFEPLPVTDADREELRRGWMADANQGELPDWWSRLPATKPPVTGLFFRDDETNTWVEQQTRGSEARVFDIFDAEGRYLGAVALPYALANHPSPKVRGDFLYGVTSNELDVDYMVKLRIVK